MGIHNDRKDAFTILVAEIARQHGEIGIVSQETIDTRQASPELLLVHEAITKTIASREDEDLVWLIQSLAGFAASAFIEAKSSLSAGDFNATLREIGEGLDRKLKEEAAIYSEDIRVEPFDDERITPDVLFSADDPRPILSYQWNQYWDDAVGEMKRRSGQWVLTYNPDSPEVYETEVQDISSSGILDALECSREHLRDKVTLV